MTTLGEGERKDIRSPAIAALALCQVIRNGQVKVPAAHGDLSNWIAVNGEDEADQFTIKADLCVFPVKAHRPTSRSVFVLVDTSTDRVGASRTNFLNSGVPQGYSVASPNASASNNACQAHLSAALPHGVKGRVG